ncbi:hypothetical protein COOONC_26976, partial [Cooperia oncophora]
VKCVLVNIFGGIVNCATIANGVVAACRKIKMHVPLVVRLEVWYSLTGISTFVKVTVICSPSARFGDAQNSSLGRKLPNPTANFGRAFSLAFLEQR